MRVLIIGLLALFATPTLIAQTIQYEILAALPQPVSNNAVALLSNENGVFLYSFLGLGSGRKWSDTSSAAAVLSPGDESWTELSPVPGGSGRLAASAVSAAGAVWVFGGYTVDADGGEVSVPGVYRIHPGESELQWVTDMPVPVEDSVVLAHMDRYVYMVSGWHDLGNVNLVQVLDTKTMKWAQATPWPGAPVFGHAGGISKGQMLVCDGVRIQYPAGESPRKFLPSNQCWSGKIDSGNHRRIQWRPVSVHPGDARYRMAATGDSQQRIVFAGGSENPYNFNGIGYDGVAAEPETSVFAYSFKTGDWQLHGDLPHGSMDHRGLPFYDGWYYLVGGMRSEQTVVPEVLRFRIAKP